MCVYDVCVYDVCVYDVCALVSLIRCRLCHLCVLLLAPPCLFFLVCLSDDGIGALARRL